MRRRQAFLRIRLSSLLTAVVTASLACSSLAQGQEWLKGVADPTRPPDEVLRRAAGGTDAALAASGAQDAASAPPPVPLGLTAIRYDAANGVGVAVINDQVVKVGDVISGMTVKSISKDEVLLNGANGARRLSLFGDAGGVGIKSSRKHKHHRKEEK